MFTATEPKLTDNTATVRALVPVTETCWIAVRCFEKREDTFRFAHTAPVWISVSGKPFSPKLYAAEYFLGKTREVIAAAGKQKFPNEESRNAAMDVYRKAEEMYAGIMQMKK
jgi:hypothetical protein